jgi:hypothetical protein
MATQMNCHKLLSDRRCLRLLKLQNVKILRLMVEVEKTKKLMDEKTREQKFVLLLIS